jgi:hypothetical protein
MKKTGALLHSGRQWCPLSSNCSPIFIRGYTAATCSCSVSFHPILPPPNAMNNEYRPEVLVKPWGPFISPNYVNERITKADIIVASIVWTLTLVNVIIGCWLAVAQTKHSRSPSRSVYVWMIWLELIASFIMGLECILHLLKHIPPSECFKNVSGEIMLTFFRFLFLLFYS